MRLAVEGCEFTFTIFKTEGEDLKYNIFINQYNSTFQVIGAANEVVDSVDRDELEKFILLKIDPEDEEEEVCI